MKRASTGNKSTKTIFRALTVVFFFCCLTFDVGADEESDFRVTRVEWRSDTIANLDLASGPAPLEGSHAGRITTYEGTVTCLACHQTEAQEVHNSVHYQWLGNASETIVTRKWCASRSVMSRRCSMRPGGA